MTKNITSITSHGMARKVLQSKTVAHEIAERFGKSVPDGNGKMVQLTPFVSMTNKQMGNTRRTILVGLPNKIQEFVSSL